MAEPTLNGPHRNTGLVVHHCERLAETMQNPIVAHRFVFAAPTGTVVTTSAVQTRPECQTLVCAEHVTVRLAVRQGEDEPRVGIPQTARLEQGKLGLREQEIMYAEWADFDWHESAFRVQGKKHWGFAVKDSEQREIPCPADLLARLDARRQTHPQARLVVGTSSDSPNSKLLRSLKRLAKRSGLKCGKCQGCFGNLKECQEWTLHKLRRTYCTTLLRNGVDLKTVKHYMGHADLASTMRYLRPAAGREAQHRINSIQFA